ncbi:MAG: hypothetical protein JXA46_07945 [Dehalococcoidales bacterium]|nr:hypothetical protein [Dehalococcoidales bacterium]
MENVKIIRLRSVISIFFVFLIAMAHANTFAAEPAGKTGSVSIEVLNPEAEMIMASEISTIAPRIKDLSDKNIGLVWAGKSGGEFFLDALEVLLKKKYPSATISRHTRGVGDAEERILREVDAFVYAVGDSGQGAWDSISFTIRLEKLGKPGVAVFGEHLIYNAKAASYHLGMPSVRMAPLPSMEFYPNRSSAESMMPCGEAVLDEIIDALTRPIQPSEKEAGLKTKKTAPDTVKIAGDSLESAYEKFYQLFMDNDWGDGLPLVPPTPFNVEQMLKATSLSPDTILGVIKAPDGSSDIANVTVEKVAVNAVMAGAKPEYFPVIIAAMEGISDRRFSHHVFSSDGSFNLFIAVTGPIAKKINMHSGTGLLGHGWRANNTIGRAVRLCMNNIGHLKPGKLDTALTGRASSHTFYILAENDELSPWAPYHTVRGYRAEDSYVTVSGIGLGGDFTIYGGGTGGAWTVDEVLEGIINRIAPNRRMFASYMPGIGSGAFARPFNYIFVLSPDTAQELKKRGFTRQSLQDYIIEKTSVPYEDLSEAEIEGLKRRLSEKTEAFGGTDNIPDDRIPVFWANLKPGGKIPVIVSPEHLNIFVSGDVSGYNFGAIYLLGAHSIKPVQ